MFETCSSNFQTSHSASPLNVAFNHGDAGQPLLPVASVEGSSNGYARRMRVAWPAGRPLRACLRGARGYKPRSFSVRVAVTFISNGRSPRSPGGGIELSL